MADQKNNKNQEPMIDPEMSVEEAFAQLQELIGTMEADGVSLEDSFRSYEKGMALVRFCSEKIDRVEKKVQMMNADGSLDDFN